MVEDYWSITESYRIQGQLSAKSTGSVGDYMKDFPCLKKPSGYITLVSYEKRTNINNNVLIFFIIYCFNINAIDYILI